MVRIPKTNPVEFLVDRKFPNAHLLRIPPQVSNFSVAITKMEKQAILQYEAELKAMHPDQLQKLFDVELEKYRQDQATRAEKAEQQRFFNLPSADANFDHWSKAAYWSLDEAIALSLGKEPEIVTWESLKNDHSFPPSPFIEKYKKLRELVLRAKIAHKLSDPCNPSTFLSWAQQTRIHVSPKLIGKMETLGSVSTNWENLYVKLKEQHESLKIAYTSISNELEQFKDNKNSQSTVTNSHYWLKLKKLAERANEQYPDWRQVQRKVQKTGNLHEWLVNSIGADSREAEIIKKILSDIHE